MQFYGKRAASRAMLAAAFVALVACSDRDESSLPTEGGSAPATLAQSSSTPAHQKLAQLVALALRDASVRGSLHRALSASPVKEGKLHLSTHLQGDGAVLLQAMARAGGLTPSEVLGLLDQTGALELYLPVDAHRAHWKGGTDLLVAAQLDEQAAPFGVDLGGRPVMLSLGTVPAAPTLSLVPAESFDAEGKPYQSDLRSLADRSGRPGSSSFSTSTSSWTGIWINEVHVGDHSNYEPWTKGDPEFEMWLENGSTNPRSTLVCAEQDYSVEPYRWDMNGNDYTKPFLIGEQNEVPQSTNLVIAMWEDDDKRCELVQDKDYVKLTVEAITNAYGAYKAIKQKEYQNGEWVVKLYHAYVNARAVVTTADDFVGVSSGDHDITGTAKTFQLKNTSMNNVGWMSVQWKADVAH